MERLTEKDSGLDFKLVDSDDFDAHTWCQYANEAVNRLAAYEDTGLEPDHLHELQNSAFDLGYQTCLHDRENISWRGAEELQAYRAIGTVEHLTELVKAEQERWEGRGYWEEIRGSDQFCVHYYACSKCHNAALRDDIGMQVLSNLCPHCGRDLRGESHDGD